MPRQFTRRFLSFLAFVFVFAGIAANAQDVVGVTIGQLNVSNSGAATYTIPIEIPPGIGGLQPNLALSYSSKSGGGTAGYGWGISSLSAITRCAQTQAHDGSIRGVKLDSQDNFCLDGKRLRPISGTHGTGGAEYRTEIDEFIRITLDSTDANGPVSN